MRQLQYSPRWQGDPQSGSKRSGGNREENELSAANPKSKGLRYEAGINDVDMAGKTSKEWRHTSLRRSTQRNYGRSLQCNENGVYIKAVRTEHEIKNHKLAVSGPGKLGGVGPTALVLSP